MKLVWITNRFTPDPGGMSRSCTRIVGTLRSRGHALHLVRLTSNPDCTAKSAPAHASFSQFETRVDAARPEDAYFFLKGQFSESIFVGFGGGYPSYLATMWAAWSGGKSVSLMRGNDFDRLIHDAKQGWMVHHVLKNADLVGAVSTEMAARIRRLRSRPVCFTPNGIDPSAWEVFEGDREKARAWRAANNIEGKAVIGVFGQLKTKKGLDIAIDVFNSSRIRPLASLLTVGDVPPLVQKALSEKLGQNWLRAEYCLDDDLPSFYLASDFVLIPSHYDGMPNVLLEAMIMKTPVIASDAGAMPDVLTNKLSGLLFKAGDCLDAEKAVYEALTMPREIRDRMTRAALKRAEDDFTPAAEALALEDAIAAHLINGAAHGL